MTEPERSVLPLFPLGTVLFPGLVLPLRIFEERYRELVRSLMEEPDAGRRVFGVVAIRRGWEVSQRADELDLYEVGCTAQVRTVNEHPDGSFDIVTVGRRRFTIHELVDGPTHYARASVTLLPEPAGEDGEADALGPRVLARFRAYLRAFRAGSATGENDSTAHIEEEQLPDDPLRLSHLVAATASLSVADRQALLAAPDTATRLREELRLLQLETWLLTQIRAVPATLADLTVRPGPN